MLVTFVEWNGIRTAAFPILNGVNQGGIISPILFCVYLDGLLQRLSELRVGCNIGQVFVGVLAYADDVVLIAPTASAMREMLDQCDRYAREFNVVFNVKKSKCMIFTAKLRGP